VSRSNPSENSNPNPAARYFEWNGEHGVIRYYDKATKKNVDIGADFTFILLDQLASVRGWHDDSGSGIYSNEVKDTTQETLVVKAFKGGTLAEGFYRDIKDRVNRLGGSFTQNLYIAFKDGGELKIAVLRFKGSALGAWMEFTKAHKTDLYTKAIRIKSFTEGKKGRVVFRTPVLTLKDIDRDTDRAALALDKELQDYFKAYFRRTKREQVETPHEPVESDGYEQDGEVTPEHYAATTTELTDDDIPFSWALPFLLPAVFALHQIAQVTLV
jgi:hypothetical protein